MAEAPRRRPCRRRRPGPAAERVTLLLATPGGRRASPLVSPCTAALARTWPCSGRCSELGSGELRRPRSLSPAPLDADDDGLRPGGLRASGLRSQRKAGESPPRFLIVAGETP